MRLSSITLLNIFLWETLALNIMSFEKNKQLIRKTTDAIFHNNHHVYVYYSANMRYLLILFVKSEVFYIKPGNGLDVTKEFKDLYANFVIAIAKTVAINFY